MIKLHHLIVLTTFQFGALYSMDRATKKFYKTHILEIPNSVINAINHGYKTDLTTFLDSNPSAFRARAIKENYNTLLMYAARTGSISMMSLIIQSGTDVNKTNSDGWSALTFAARHGHVHAVKFLVENGADINLRSTEGKTLLDLTIPSRSYRKSLLQSPKYLMQIHAYLQEEQKKQNESLKQQQTTLKSSDSQRSPSPKLPKFVNFIVH